MTWFDTPNGALDAKCLDLEADGWLRCEMSDGVVMLDPPEGSRAGRRYFSVRYSEARDQYRAVAS